MNILVTGCLGTIGIFTVNELLKRGHKVIGIDDCSGNPEKRISEINKNPNFQFFNLNYWTLDYIIKNNNIDSILHLAGKIGTSDSFLLYDEYIDNNIKFTLELLNYAKEYNIKRFVFASSSSVYDGRNIPSTENDIVYPSSIYGVTKLACEKILNIYNKNFNIETIALRYYNVFAPIKYYGYRSVIALFSEKILNNEQIYLFNNGKQRRQYVPVDNIVYANVLALETKNEKCFGEIFNITVDEKPIDLVSLVEYLYKKYNKKPNYILKEEHGLGDIALYHGSNEKAKKYLGYKVLKTMKDGLDEYVSYFIKENSK